MLPVEVEFLQSHEKKHVQGLTKECKARKQDLFGKHNIKDALQCPIFVCLAMDNQGQVQSPCSEIWPY